MENLNAEQVIKALECCSSKIGCKECPLQPKESLAICVTQISKYALALITSQEQRIGAQDMTISELRKRAEKAEHDADRYAQRIKELTIDLEAMRGAANSYKMHNKELTAKVAKWEEECDLRGDMWCKLNEENKRLTEENEKLLTELANYDRLTDVRIVKEYYTAEAYEEIREENERLRAHIQEGIDLANQIPTMVVETAIATVKKMHSEIKERCIKGGIYPAFVASTIDQIAKEMLEGE